MIDLMRASGLYEVTEVIPYNNRSILGADTRPTYMKGLVVVEYENGEYRAIDYQDHHAPHKMACKGIMRDPRCIQVLKLQYYQRGLVSYPKISPLFYYPYHPEILTDEFITQCRSTRRIYDNIYFRGTKRGIRRSIIRRLAGARILNDAAFKKISATQMYTEMSKHKIALSLPGVGLACHREIEAFALGTPVMMLQCATTYRVPLIPDYHYIAIKWSKSRAVMARQMIARYKAVINDEGLLRTIAENAAKWYDTYIRIPNGSKHILAAMGIGLK